MKTNATCCLTQTCSRDLAWVGVFARSSISPAKSTSEIVFAKYRLPFFNLKPYSFIRSIDVRSTKSWQNMNWYGANEYPYRPPATMSKKSESPSGERTLTFMFYRASLWLWQFLWGHHTLVIFTPSSLCVWSQMPWKNLRIRASPQRFLQEFILWFDGLSESMMLWIGFSENHFDSF